MADDPDDPDDPDNPDNRPTMPAGTAGSLTRMAYERPRPDVAKLLAIWTEWEKGDSAGPGRVVADLKTAGMKELLTDLAEAAALDA